MLNRLGKHDSFLSKAIEIVMFTIFGLPLYIVKYKITYKLFDYCKLIVNKLQLIH